MSAIAWDALFEHGTRERPATESDIEYLIHSTLAPLSEIEIVELRTNQRNPFPRSHSLYHSYEPFDPSRWELPKRTFPASFIDFLRWSNGGNFVNGHREFGMFDPQSIREYLLAYNIPEYMSGAIPFALDGGGGFFLFDMRQDLHGGEYPIAFSHSGNLGWEHDEYAIIAASFAEACSDPTDPNSALLL